MKNHSRLLLPLTLILILLTAACGAQGQASPTAVGTILPDNNGLTGTPFLTPTLGAADTATAIGTATGLTGLETPTLGVGGAATQEIGTPVTGGTTQGAATVIPGQGLTQTPLVPVTGSDIMLVECQFCVDTRAHALLVLPDTATFNIVSPAPPADGTKTDADPRCTTVEVNNGRQVVLCSGPEMTPLVVNICTDANNCTNFPVDLLACPLSEGGQVTPAQTNKAPAPAPATGNNGTATASVPLATSTPNIIISTPTP